MDLEQNPTVLCAENIGLLFLLHSVPCVPKTTPINRSLIRERGYDLPFDKERGLASTLAFLSSIRDDPNRIPALCIESVPDACALRVHVAVNKSSFEDGKADLLEMKVALSKILTSLSRVTDSGGNSDTAENVFDVIMAVCSGRILGRLRLQLNHKQKIKKPIDETLGLAVASLKQLGKRMLDRAELMDSVSAFETKANEVVKLVAAWTKHQTTIRLRDLVEGIHKIWMIDRLDELLDCIPNNVMDPGLRTSLRNIISKVARYKEASRYLHRMAKRFPSLRKTEVLSVTLQQQMFDRMNLNHYSPSLSATLHRIARKHNLHHKPNKIYPLLELGKEKAEQIFSDHVRRALEGAKIHAEIQLFYHTEALHLAQPPRVVCSSKDACYLCDYFITAVTKIHSPKCHGRLYPGWRLPALSVHDQTMRKFNHAIEEEAGNSIRNLLRSQRKFKLPDPRESTVLTIGRSISTLASSSLCLNTEALVIEDINMSPETLASEDGMQYTLQLSNELPQAVDDLPEHSVPGFHKISTTETVSRATTSDENQTSTSPGRQSDAHSKNETHRDNVIVSSVSQETMSRIHIGPLELYIEYSASPNEAGEYDRRDLKVDFEWITTANDELDLPDMGFPVINVEKSAYAASLPLKTTNQLNISHRGRILRIRLYPWKS